GAIQPWAQELAAHGEGVAIAAGERQDALVDGERRTFRSLWVGFSILESDFWQRVAFPIFVDNAIRWLAERPPERDGLRVRPADTALIGLPERIRAVTVTDPAGRARRIQADGA